MRIASAAYREFVFGGHLLALGTSSMAATVAFVIGRAPTWDLLLMAYLFSFGAYTVNRFADFDQDRVSHPDRTAHLEKRRSALPWVAGAVFLVGYLLAVLRNLPFFLGLLAPLMLALAYSLGSRGMKSALGVSRLKEGVLVKNVAISAGWSLVPVLVGLYYLDLPTAVFALMPFVFLRLMVNTIFFDLRDVEADRRFGVGTLPSRVGIERSSLVMNLIDLASGAYVAAAAVAGAVPSFALALVLFTPYSMAYRVYARTGRHRDSLRDVAADGEYLLWGVVTYLGHL
jgi:4-hydroxybenzoate polyprenyltransferase